MDGRRLNTGEVLDMGVLGMPMPETEIPEDRESVRADVDEPLDDDLALNDRGALLTALDRGAVIHCSEYYGIPYVWKDESDYRGTLLQYRAVTEAPRFATADEALDWFAATAHSVAG